MRVRVYRNLRSKCFSVQCAKTRKVIDHVQDIVLSNVKFVVSQAGRQRVLRTGQKNVHAYIIGEIAPTNHHYMYTEINKVTYDPYRFDSFVLPNFNNMPIKGAFMVVCKNGKEVYAIA